MSEKNVLLILEEGKLYKFLGLIGISTYIWYSGENGPFHPKIAADLDFDEFHPKFRAGQLRKKNSTLERRGPSVFANCYPSEKEFKQMLDQEVILLRINA